MRIPKKYRPAALDEQIRSYRTVHEPQLMHEAKAAGVPTPLIYMVNVPESSIIMEYIEGQQVKQLLNKVSKAKRHDIMRQNRRIHRSTAQPRLNPWRPNNLQHDIKPKRQIFFVDFGLGEKNGELEAQGVDLHLLKRALQSTHYLFWEECFQSVLMWLHIGFRR